MARLRGGEGGPTPTTTPAVRLPRISANPLTWLGGMWRTAVDTVTAAEHAAVGLAELTASLLSSPHESSLTGPLTTVRRYTAARVKLAEME
jgi:diacylglycerol O-acyltransferase